MSLCQHQGNAEQTDRSAAECADRQCHFPCHTKANHQPAAESAVCFTSNTSIGRRLKTSLRSVAVKIFMATYAYITPTNTRISILLLYLSFCLLVVRSCTGSHNFKLLDFHAAHAKKQLHIEGIKEDLRREFHYLCLPPLFFSHECHCSHELSVLKY